MSSPFPPVPAQLSDLRTILGSDDLVFAFVLRFGGLRVHVPHQATSASQITIAVGPDAAKRLSAAWGGDRPRIPLLRWWLARCLKAHGKSSREIAVALRISESSVPDLLKGRRRSRDPVEDREEPRAPTERRRAAVPA